MHFVNFLYDRFILESELKFQASILWRSTKDNLYRLWVDIFVHKDAK